MCGFRITMMGMIFITDRNHLLLIIICELFAKEESEIFIGFSKLYL